MEIDCEKILNLFQSTDKQAVEQVSFALKHKNTNREQFLEGLVLLYQLVSQDAGYREFFRYVQDCIVQTVVMLSPRGMSSDDERIHNVTPRVSGVSFPINRKNTHQLNVSEFTFCSIFQDIVASFNEAQVLDMFDSLDTGSKGTVSVECTYMLLCMLVAKEAGVLTRFLYQFGQFAYDLFMVRPKSAAPTTVQEHTLIAFAQEESFRKLGQLAWLDDYDMTQAIQYSHIKKKGNVMAMTREEYIPLYFGICKKSDQRQKASVKKLKYKHEWAKNIQT
jgi:hypothetical protein